MICHSQTALDMNEVLSNQLGKKSSLSLSFVGSNRPLSKKSSISMAIWDCLTTTLAYWSSIGSTVTKFLMTYVLAFFAIKVNEKKNLPTSILGCQSTTSKPSSISYFLQFICSILTLWSFVAFKGKLMKKSYSIWHYKCIKCSYMINLSWVGPIV